METAPNSNYRTDEFNKFVGMNLDVPPDRLSPEYLSNLVNMKVGDKGLPETINGCTLSLDVGADIESAGYYQTRGEDYLFVYAAGSIYIYKYPSMVLVDTLLDGELNEKVWFAEHNGEFYFGNMSDGMWRWRFGDQPLIRGSAPLDVIVKVDEESKTSKQYTEWQVSYDYEYRGGRSALSRYARVRLFNEKHTIRVIMDYPPDISANRRIYVRYNTSITTTPVWSDWYFVKEVEDNDETSVVLDRELAENLTDGRKYSDDTKNIISPRAMMGISHGNRIWLAYTVESPTIVRASKIAQPYFDDRDSSDLLEVPTNMLGLKEVTIISTENKIFSVSLENDEQNILVHEGAYRDTMQMWNGSLVFENERGWRIFDGQKVDTISGINSVKFSKLQKEKRFILISSQKDFNSGTFVDDITASYVPGALTLKPYLGKHDPGLVLDGQSSTADDFGTTQHTEKYKAQPINVPGDGGKITLGGLKLGIRSLGLAAGDKFQLSIVTEDEDNVGQPDLSSDAIVASFNGVIPTHDHGWNSLHWFPLEFDEAIEINENETYFIVIPYQGTPGNDWKYQVWADVDSDMYGDNKLLWSIEGTNGTWTSASLSGHDVYLKFLLLGYSDNVITHSPLYYFWKDNGLADGYKYDYAQAFFPDKNYLLKRGQVLLDEQVGAPGDPVIKVVGDSGGEPDDTNVIATATNLSLVGDIMSFDFAAEEMTAGETYWLLIEKTGDAGNHWKWQCSKLMEIMYASGVTEYVDYTLSRETTSWDTGNQSMWMKIFATDPVEYAQFASEGQWVSPEFDIKDGNNFLKLFAGFNRPEGADIKIELRGYDQSGSAWGDYQTIYDSSTEPITDLLPYDISSSLDDDIIKVQVKITLQLGDADYTPSVDSILIFYQNSGDAGNRLHSANIKGDYVLSLEDEEISYCISKYGGWYKMDKAFYGFLPIGDDVVLGIGKNSSESYRNLYELDDVESDTWFYGDSIPVPIETSIKTAYIGYNYIIKSYRKLFMSTKGDADKILSLIMNVSGAERDIGSEVNETYTDNILLKEDIKSIYYSLPGRMKGRYFQITVNGLGVDWIFSGFNIEYWLEYTHNISSAIPDSSITVELASTEALTNPHSSDFLGNYLFVGTSDSIFPHEATINKYFVDSDGTATILKTITLETFSNISDIIIDGSYVYALCNSAGGGAYFGAYFRVYDYNLTLVGEVEITVDNHTPYLAVSDDSNYAWMTNYDDEKVYCIDMTTKASPTSSTVLTGEEFLSIKYYNGYLLIGDNTDKVLRVYDISDYSLLKELNIATTIRDMTLDKDNRKLFCARADNYLPAIIDIKNIDSPIVIIDIASGSIMNGSVIARKLNYLFVLNKVGDKVTVIDTVDSNLLELESTLSSTTGSGGIHFVFNGWNLLAWCDNDDDVIRIFKIYGV